MKLARLRWVLAALAFCSAAPPLAAAAPAEAPPLVGVVQDTAGRPLPNAQVVIASAGRRVTTAADGTFVIRGLPAGTYHLDVSLIGYAPGHVETTLAPDGAASRVTVVLVPTPLALEGLVVTGTPGAADPLRVSQSTVQLSGKALERNLGATVAQTLSQEPGVDTRYNGPAASTPVIRGLSGDRVLVLQNGQRTGDLSGAAPDHSLSIDPLAATQIEVVRGPASLLYGSGALGGVVNVIATDIPTSIPNHLQGYAAAQGESASPGGAGTAELTVPLSQSVALTLRGGGRRVDDVRVGGGGTLGNSYFRNLHADAGVGYVGEAFSGGAAFNAYGFNYGLPSADGEGSHIEGHRQEAKTRAALVLNNDYLRDLRLDATAQRYAHDEIESTGEIGTSFKLNTQTLNLVGRTGFLHASGVVGLSGLFKQYQSAGDEALTPAANSDNGGIFVYQEVPLGGADTARSPKLQLGARYDLYRIASEAGNAKFGPARSLTYNAFSGSAGVNVPVGGRVSLGASVARAFRAPTVEELFSNAFHAAVGSFDVGNPDLVAETNSGVEGVLRAQSAKVTTQLSAYYNRIDNYVTPNLTGSIRIEEGGDSVTVPLNVYTQADARLRGVEGRVEGVVAPNVVLGALGDFVRGDFVDGGPLPFMPPAHLGGSARWDNGRFSAGTELRHAFEQDRTSQPNCLSGPGCVDVPTPAYTLLEVDAGLNVINAGRVHNIVFRVSNLLNRRYYDATSRIKDFAPNPGRNISLVYKVLF